MELASSSPPAAPPSAGSERRRIGTQQAAAAGGSSLRQRRRWRSRDGWDGREVVGSSFFAGAASLPSLPSADAREGVECAGPAPAGQGAPGHI
jgi:hypothetical protein